MSFKKLFTINLQPKKTHSEQTVTHVGMMTLDTTIIFMERNSMTMAINAVKGELIVKVPHRMTMSQAKQFIKDKEGWLVKKISESSDRRKNHIEREYKHGATHLLLGKEFTLNIIISNRRVAPVFENGILTLHVPTEEYIKPVLRKWYAKMAPTLFAKIVSPQITEFMKRYSKSPSEMEYKFVTSYWGVCTSRGCIRLNIELLRAPKECIEYIMAHELCHLVHQNHSARFYKLLTEFMPDWKERKEILEKIITCKY